jgi:hypothetical protein
LNVPGFVAQPGLADLGIGVLPAAAQAPAVALREPARYIYQGFDTVVTPASAIGAGFYNPTESAIFHSRFGIIWPGEAGVFLPYVW